MVKFTISLNNKSIKSQVFDKNVINIGRNNNNDLSIDNPAVAPVHATITLNGYAYIITQSDKDYPLIINDKETKEARLINNDKIAIDNYTITFNSARIIFSSHNDNVIENSSPPIKEKIIIPNANVQILSGEHIGRVISLKNNKVTFGKSSSGSGLAIISKQSEGYSISLIEAASDITVNFEPLGKNSVILNNNDMLVIDNISMQFFQEN
ncbi:MAG: FHA domain-containing protein [Methylococcaceae bacterium]|nr:FHA domain-containing protein [Methylococcaceae bacterium]